MYSEEIKKAIASGSKVFALRSCPNVGNPYMPTGGQQGVNPFAQQSMPHSPQTLLPKLGLNEQQGFNLLLVLSEAEAPLVEMIVGTGNLQIAEARPNALLILGKNIPKLAYLLKLSEHVLEERNRFTGEM